MKKKCKLIHLFNNKPLKQDLLLKDLLMSNLTLQDLSNEMLYSLLKSGDITPAIFVTVEHEIIRRLNNSVKGNVKS